MNQRLKNALKHRFRLLQHFVVPEPDYTKAKSREMMGALELIEQVLIVMTSIYFNDQSCAQTYEVRDVRPERNLPPESIAA